MSDWPYGQFDSDTILSSVGPTSIVGDLAVATSQAFNTSAVWPAANRALFVPVWINRQATVYKMSFVVATQSGNYDIGLYDEFGHRLVRATAAVPVAGIAIADVADTVIGPGVYFLALNIDNVVASVRRLAIGALVTQLSGCMQQAVGALTLPDPFTLAAMASAYVPVITAHLRVTV